MPGTTAMAALPTSSCTGREKVPSSCGGRVPRCLSVSGLPAASNRLVPVRKGREANHSGILGVGGSCKFWGSCACACSRSPTPAGPHRVQIVRAAVIVWTAVGAAYAAGRRQTLAAGRGLHGAGKRLPRQVLC